MPIPEEPSLVQAYANAHDLTIYESLTHLRFFNNLEILLQEGATIWRRMALVQQMDAMESAMTRPPQPTDAPAYRAMPEYWYGRAEAWGMMFSDLTTMLELTQTQCDEILAATAPKESDTQTEQEEKEELEDGYR